VRANSWNPASLFCGLGMRNISAILRKVKRKENLALRLDRPGSSGSRMGEGGLKEGRGMFRGLGEKARAKGIDDAVFPFYNGYKGGSFQYSF